MQFPEQDPFELPDDPDGLDLDEEFPLGDGTADGTATVSCPWCGESVDVFLDPGSGAHQDYVEDCAVCCRPWRVLVSYDEEGRAHVTADPLDSRASGAVDQQRNAEARSKHGH